MHLEKNRTYACTFPVQRKEIEVVKVRFTMRYSSRKLSNDKVIATARNFWRQIACSFQVMSGNILFLGNKIFEIPPFFQTRPGDLGKKVHACSLRFSALKPATGCTFNVILTSSVQYDKILSKFGQQQLVMVSYACFFNQSETGKYFEWIVINNYLTRLSEMSWFVSGEQIL